MSISIVCLYNNKKILDKFLLKSLGQQTAKYELILVNNTENKLYQSAAEALNKAGARAKNKYIIFVHQDINLLSATWLADAEALLENIPQLGIAGIAGMSKHGLSNQERGRNIILHGEPPRKWQWGHKITKPEPVQTLDECLLIIPRAVFNKISFDEKTCSDWHLYGVDYCLSVQKVGYQAYVLPLTIYHQSAGASFSKKYFNSLKKVMDKHKKFVPVIYTTLGNWYTRIPLDIQLGIKSFLHYFLHRVNNLKSKYG